MVDAYSVLVFSSTRQHQQVEELEKYPGLTECLTYLLKGLLNFIFVRSYGTLQKEVTCRHAAQHSRMARTQITVQES